MQYAVSQPGSFHLPTLLRFIYFVAYTSSLLILLLSSKQSIVWLLYICLPTGFFFFLNICTHVYFLIQRLTLRHLAYKFTCLLLLDFCFPVPSMFQTLFLYCWNLSFWATEHIFWISWGHHLLSFVQTPDMSLKKSLRSWTENIFHLFLQLKLIFVSEYF